MFKKIFISLMLVTPAFAAPPSYKFKLKFQAGDAAPMAGTVVVRNGEEGKFTFDDKVIRFTPTQQGKNTIKISSVVSENDKVVSKPSVIVRLHETAEITQSDSSGKKIFSLKWTPELSSQ